MIFIWLKFFQVAMTPEDATAEERTRFARMASAVKYCGLVFVGLGLIAAIYWGVERHSFGSAPSDTIAVQDFAEENYQGRFNEARIAGVLHLDRITAVRNINGYSEALIPFTAPDWKPGETVRVYVQTHLFLYDQQAQMSGEPFEMGLNHLQIPLDSRGPTAVSILVKRPTTPISDTEASSGPIYVTYVKDAWRKRKISDETAGLLMLAQLFCAMGFGIAAVGFFARRSIVSVQDT